MRTFFLFGTYSTESYKKMGEDRTKKVMDVIADVGGKVGSLYVLMGAVDLVIIAHFPGIDEAMKASVMLSRITGIDFSTSPAVTAEQFDGMVEDL